MGLVRKYHYSMHGVGVELRDLVNKHKARTEVKARRHAKSSITRFSQYINDYPEFQGANDAILEYIPNGNNNAKRMYCANSFVNDKFSPFANIRITYTGKYILIPRKSLQKFNYVITNKERELGRGHRRENDTEYKLLEKIAAITNPIDVGHINLYTYYEPCLSCDYVIVQFTQKYPNISINVYFEEEYRPEKGVI